MKNDITAEPESSGLLAQTTGEVLSQLQAARAHPRNVDTFRRSALAWACVDPDTAASCFYAVPRDGKTIEGPSIRLAEIAAIAWGNLRVRTRLIGRDERTVTVEAEVWDLETNAAFAASETGRITKRDGKPYSEDMVQTTIRATAAKARRNAILSVIPGAFLKPVLREARKLAIGEASALADTRAKALEALQKMGVSQARVLAKLGKASVQLIDHDDLLVLRAGFTAIKNGDSTVDEEFPEPVAAPEPKAAPDPFAPAQAAAPAPTPTPAQTQAPADPAPATDAGGPMELSEADRSGLVKRYVMLQMSAPAALLQAAGSYGTTRPQELPDAELQRIVETAEQAAAALKRSKNKGA